MPKPVSRGRPSTQLTKILAGSQVLVDEAAQVGVAEGSGDADREAQEAIRLHGRAEQPSERFAAGVLEHQHGPGGFAHKLQRPRRPGAVQLVFQFVFMGEAFEDGGRRAFPRRQYNQRGALISVGRAGAILTKNAFAVLPP